MDVFSDTWKNTGNIHHAYCIEGKGAEVIVKLRTFFEHDLDFTTTANPDFYLKESETMTIDDGRELKEIHLRKAFGPSGRKIHIIKTNTITREAQNALLKIFEEPKLGNHFFLVVPSAAIILPTLRSRMVIVKDGISEPYDLKTPEHFFKAPVAKRLEIVKDLIEAIQNEEKTKADAVLFVDQLERTKRTATSPEKMTKKDVWLLEELSKCRRYLGDRAPSVKQLLEHIALIS